MPTTTPTRTVPASWSDVWDDAGDTTATDSDSAYAASTDYFERWCGREFAVSVPDTYAVEAFLQCPDHRDAGIQGPICACMLPFLPRFSRDDISGAFEIHGPGPWRIVDYNDGGGWDDEGGVMYPQWEIEPAHSCGGLYVNVGHYNDDGSPNGQIATPLDPRFVINAWVTPPGFGRPV